MFSRSYCFKLLTTKWLSLDLIKIHIDIDKNHTLCTSFCNKFIKSRAAPAT